MACQATIENHCCWIDSVVCPHFDAAAGVGKFCSLRTELGSWDAVHVDKRYPKRLVEAKILCGDYPTRVVCGACGAAPVVVS